MAYLPWLLSLCGRLSRMWGAYLVGKPHTPTTTITHEDHFKYVPRPAATDAAMSEEPVAESGERGQKRGSSGAEPVQQPATGAQPATGNKRTR